MSERTTRRSRRGGDAVATVDKDTAADESDGGGGEAEAEGPPPAPPPRKKAAGRMDPGVGGEEEGASESTSGDAADNLNAPPAAIEGGGDGPPPESADGDGAHDEDEEGHPREPVLLGEKPRGMYECDYCGADLSRAPRIRCAVCPDFDLCLECFANEDHERMGRYKREEEARRRAEAEEEAAAAAEAHPVLGGAAPPSEPPDKRGRGRKRKAPRDLLDDLHNEDPSALGSYVGGLWIPFFRHRPDHPYLVADSTRYMMFPSFRGVRPVAAPGVAEVGGNLNFGDAGGPDDGRGGGMEEPKPDGSDGDHVEAIANAQDTAIHSNAVPAQDGGSSESAMDVDEAKNRDEASAEPENPSPGGADGKPDPDPTSDPDGGGDKNACEKERTASARSEPPAAAAALAVVQDSSKVWTAEEDLRLLDGILTCGLGNWADISEHMSGAVAGEAVQAPDPGGCSIGIKSEQQCMERYLDDFMGRYGRILPPYTMVAERPADRPDGPPGAAGGDEAGNDGAPEEGHAEDNGASAADDTGINGISGSLRKRPRRMASAEDEMAPGFKKVVFRPEPTESLDDSADLYHPYLPPVSGVKVGDEVARDLWYRSEQNFIRQLAGASSKAEADSIRSDFVKQRALGVPGYEANVLPPRLDDVAKMEGHELVGYMPRRGDFDVEWSNDAEKLISEIEFTSEDTKDEKELKLRVLDIFNRRVDEREERKRVVIEHGLLNYKENQEKMWLMDPDERHLVQRMRLFARYHSREEHEAFVRKTLEAKRLRKEIAKLETYQRMGIKKLSDCERYELDKSRRVLHKDAWLKKEKETKKSKKSGEGGENKTVLRPSVAAFLPGKRATRPSAEIWKQFAPPEAGGGAVNGGTTCAPSENGAGKPTDPMDCDGDRKPAAASEPTKPPPSDERKPEDEQKPSADKFVIKDKPGFDLLSKKEIGVCKRHSLLPMEYVSVKRALIADAISKGIVDPRRPSNQSLFKVDVSSRKDVVDFVLSSGWVPEEPFQKKQKTVAHPVPAAVPVAAAAAAQLPPSQQQSTTEDKPAAKAPLQTLPPSPNAASSKPAADSMLMMPTSADAVKSPSSREVGLGVLENTKPLSLLKSPPEPHVAENENL